jgi:hypothetical protein
MRLLKYVRRYVNLVTTNFIWPVLHGRASGSRSEAELEFLSIERAVEGKSRAEDYLLLPLWQSYSVADKQEMGLLKGDSR